LSRATREAEQANRLKDEFLATLSHELRTPLNAILGYSRILRTGAIDPERQTRALEVLERNATALSRIVEDVLDVSRIITGKTRLDVQPVDVVSVIDHAVATVRPAADAKGVQLQAVLDRQTAPISGDADRLQQVIWNLLSNAVKFTNRGGRVQVQLVRVNSHVEIVVSDTGIGIAPEFLPHVFDRFRQADSRFSRQHGGLGLGLFNLLGPRRVRQPAVRFDDLPPISIVLLSHNHYDHCDLRTLGLLAQRFDPIVVTPLGNGALVRSSGIRRVEELDWWDQAKASAMPIVLTPAHHFSARSPLDRNRALWGGFMLASRSTKIYFAGDTAYASFFRDVRQRLGASDLALLPIGAYEPRWFMQPVHMNPCEAVQAHLDLEAAESIGMHFGTFQMTIEGIDDPLRALEDAPRASRIPPSTFRTLGFGESVRVG
jgi:L-ascorbate metabolism protein UlaG (beta-lactamase superfamily)